MSFYGDSSGTPGTLLETAGISGNANETFLQTDGSGNPAFSYSAAVTPFSVAAGTQYWMSIQASLAFPPQWGWETSTNTVGDGASYQVYSGAGGPISSDLAFTLVGQPNTSERCPGHRL